MEKLLSSFVKYPFYGKIFIVIFIIAGVWSMFTMNKASFPVVESRVISISVSYQGATPKEMEEGVVTLIENAIRGTVGIKEHSSRSQENSATVTIIVKNGYNVDQVLYDVKNVVDGISNFPAGAERPTIAKRRTSTIAIFVSLQSSSGDLIKLKDEAHRIENDFLSSGIVSQVAIRGIPSRMEMSIEVKEEELERYGLSLIQVRNAVAAYNIDSYAGLIRNPNEHIKINVRNRSVDPEVIEEIVVISNIDGSQVKIKDIGNVILQFEDTPQDSYIDGERNVLFFISNLKEEDLQATAEYINAYVDTYNEKGGEMEMGVVLDFLEILNTQLAILYSNGLQGILLVIITLSLFLNFRMSLWVAWGIPASFLGMFVIANALGISLNLISLFGMILIIGILVDDGIVIGENIYTYYERGYKPRVAAIKGTLEVLPAVLVSVATTIIAFMPIMFIQGNLEMMYEMAVVVIACLFFSVIEGMFVLPGHLASEKILSPQNKKSLYGKLRVKIDKGMFYVCNKLYIPFLKWTINNKIIVISITIAMVIFTAGLFAGGRISLTFYPQSNEDTFNIDIALKPGVRMETTLELLTEMEVIVREADSILAAESNEEPFVTRVSKQTGSSFSRTEFGEHTGHLMIFLRSLDDSSISTNDIKRIISERIGKVPEAYKMAVGGTTRFGAEVSVSLFSKDGETLVKASDELKSELAKISSLHNIFDNNQLGEREVHLKLKPLAYSLGLTPSEISSQVRAAFFGTLAQRVQEGRNEIWFYVRYPEVGRKDFGNLEMMKVRTPNGGEYPLVEVCDFEIERGVTKINHFNSNKEIRVEAFMLNPGESVLPILEEVNNNILPKLLNKYPGLTYMYQGQIKDTQEETGTIAVYFSMAFVIIILILIIYFRSFTQGIMIVTMVPLAILAAIWGHLIEGEPLSMMSIWGMIALSGTIINNAVVFMSRYNDCLVDGRTVVESLIESGRSRFRPIILTSITTTMGLFPLIRETSSNASFVKPMAISLGYGILLGTIFILAFFPALVKSANTFNMMYAKLIGKKNVTPESVETAIRDKKISLEIEQDMLEDK